jgi:hypothetical protein
MDSTMGCARLWLAAMGIIMLFCLGSGNSLDGKWDKIMYGFFALLCWGIFVGSFF